MTDYRVDVEKALCVFLTDLTGVDFVIANQNAPRPIAEYGTIYVLDDSGQGQGASSIYSEHDSDDTLLKETVKEYGILTVSLQTFYANARKNLKRVSTLINGNQGANSLSLLGLGFVDKTSIQGLPINLDNSRTEERATMTVRFNICNIELLEELTMGSIVITGEAETPTTTTNINSEVDL